MNYPNEPFTMDGQRKQTRRFDNVNQHYLRNAEIFVGYNNVALTEETQRKSPTQIIRIPSPNYFSGSLPSIGGSPYPRSTAEINQIITQELPRMQNQPPPLISHLNQSHRKIRYNHVDQWMVSNSQNQIPNYWNAQSINNQREVSQSPKPAKSRYEVQFQDQAKDSNSLQLLDYTAGEKLETGQKNAPRNSESQLKRSILKDKSTQNVKVDPYSVLQTAQAQGKTLKSLSQNNSIQTLEPLNSYYQNPTLDSKKFERINSRRHTILMEARHQAEQLKTGSMNNRSNINQYGLDSSQLIPIKLTGGQVINEAPRSISVFNQPRIQQIKSTLQF